MDEDEEKKWAEQNNRQNVLQPFHPSVLLIYFYFFFGLTVWNAEISSSCSFAMINKIKSNVLQRRIKIMWHYY